MAKFIVTASALLLSVNLALRAVPEAPLPPQQRAKTIADARLSKTTDSDLAPSLSVVCEPRAARSACTTGQPATKAAARPAL